MKIAFIGQKGIPTSGGGVERYVEGVSQNLVKLGHDVFVYTRKYYSNTGKKTWHGVNLIQLPSIYTKHLDAISHVFLATMHAMWRGYDIVHYQGVGPSLLSFIPRIFKPSIKVVVTFHSLDRNHAKWSWLAKRILTIAEWTACKFPHKTTTVSKGLQQYCLNRYNTPTTYIPNGVYTGDMKDHYNLLKKYKLDAKKYYVVVARFIKHKRIHDVIKAFDGLKNSDIKLVIIGGGKFTGEYAKRLHAQSVNPNIVFIDHMQGDKFFFMINQAAAFVSASEDEGMPITVLEALSLGTPVGLSDIVGHRDPVEGCYWYGFEVGDIVGLKKQLQYVVRYDKKVQIEAAHNQTLVRENYDWESIASSLSDLYVQDFHMPKTWQTTLF